jgi:O-antigen/teichoic acid export membrane protein
MAVASLVGSFNFIGDTLLNVQKRVGRYLVLNGVSAGLILLLTGLASHISLTVVGVAFLIAQTLTMLAYAMVHRKLIGGIVRRVRV